MSRKNLQQGFKEGATTFTGLSGVWNLGVMSGGKPNDRMVVTPPCVCARMREHLTNAVARQHSHAGSDTAAAAPLILTE